MLVYIYVGDYRVFKYVVVCASVQDHMCVSSCCIFIHLCTYVWICVCRDTCVYLLESGRTCESLQDIFEICRRVGRYQKIACGNTLTHFQVHGTHYARAFRTGPGVGFNDPTLFFLSVKGTHAIVRTCMCTCTHTGTHTHTHRLYKHEVNEGSMIPGHRVWNFLSSLCLSLALIHTHTQTRTP